MHRHQTTRRIAHQTTLRIAMVAAILLGIMSTARAADPIRIGLAEALTGSLAVIGKSGILAMEIWADKVNAAGGLLGRPVKLIYYDNQSNPANVPGIYIKLLDVDHVDIVLSGYSTNMAAPAMPIVIGRNCSLACSLSPSTASFTTRAASP
jgi:branched-chain amino acid transport system substrate-binding protein